MAEVSEQLEVEHNVPLHFNVNVTKVDKEKRLVSGVVTAEVVDKAGEIVDYATVKKFFENPELWPGNIREMHQPKAVGKKVDVEFDDANKVISMTARVSKGAPETWEKVMDGTLSMFSIGGSGDRRLEKADNGKNVKRIFMTHLSEVSLVDNGANPLAKFDIVKLDGESLIDAQPADEDDVVEKKDDEKTDEEKSKDEEKTDDEESEDEKAKKKAKKSDKEKPKDEEKTEKAVLIVGAKASRLEAIAKFMALPNVESRPRTVEVAKSMLTFLDKSEDIEKLGPEPGDIANALAVMNALESLMANEYWDARYSTPPDTPPDAVKAAQVKMLKAAIDAVLEFIVSEHNEQFAETPNPDAALPSNDMAVAMADAAIDVLKAGARNSKADLDIIQKMHDHSISLGATCVKKDDESAGDGDVAKADGASANSDTTVNTIAVADEVQKLTSELTETRSKVQEQGDTIAALNARMDEILRMARPGGPQVRAVHKNIGNETPVDEPSSDNALTPELAISALQQVANDTNDAVVKQSIATQILKIQRQTGSGRIIINT